MKIICPNPNIGSTAQKGPYFEYRSVSIQRFPSKVEKHEELGRALWKELHEKQDPTPEWFGTWLARVPNTSSCGSCQKWAIDWIKIPGNEPQFGRCWFTWTVRFHNAVNAKLGKEQWTIDKALKHWQNYE